MTPNFPSIFCLVKFQILLSFFLVLTPSLNKATAFSSLATILFPGFAWALPSLIPHDLAAALDNPSYEGAMCSELTQPWFTWLRSSLKLTHLPVKGNLKVFVFASQRILMCQLNFTTQNKWRPQLVSRQSVWKGVWKYKLFSSLSEYQCRKEPTWWYKWKWNN